MRIWREVMDDRLLGGILCAVLLLSFAFQIAGASRAAAAMISPSPLLIVCSSSVDGTHRPAETDHPKPCPCSDLCGAGAYFQVTPVPFDTSGLPIQFAGRIEIAVDHSAEPTASPIQHRYEARGPPRSSI